MGTAAQSTRWIAITIVRSASLAVLEEQPVGGQIHVQFTDGNLLMIAAQVGIKHFVCNGILVSLIVVKNSCQTGYT